MPARNSSPNKIHASVFYYKVSSLLALTEFQALVCLEILKALLPWQQGRRWTRPQPLGRSPFVVRLVNLGVALRAVILASQSVPRVQ
jgi:hypothetical protein